MELWVVYEIGEEVNYKPFFVGAFPTKEIAETFAEWYYNANGGDIEWQKAECYQSMEDFFEKFRKEIKTSMT